MNILGILALILVMFGLVAWFDNQRNQPAKPRPETGAATVQDLIIAYQLAHNNKKPEEIKNLILIYAMRGKNHPLNLHEKKILGDLFSMKLDKLWVEEIPQRPNVCRSIVYLREKPGEWSGSPDGPTEYHGKLLFTVWRADGQLEKVDPGLMITWKDDRVYFVINLYVMEDACIALRNGTKPTFRPIPLGIEKGLLKRIIQEKKLEKTLAMLDELEGKTKK